MIMPGKQLPNLPSDDAPRMLADWAAANCSDCANSKTNDGECALVELVGRDVQALGYIPNYALMFVLGRDLFAIAQLGNLWPATCHNHKQIAPDAEDPAK